MSVNVDFTGSVDRDLLKRAKVRAAKADTTVNALSGPDPAARCRGLTTLGCVAALDLLFKPGWSLALIDMVLEEVTRNQTPNRR